jgi:hypothetical protein
MIEKKFFVILISFFSSLPERDLNRNRQKIEESKTSYEKKKQTYISQGFKKETESYLRKFAASSRSKKKKKNKQTNNKKINNK